MATFFGFKIVETHLTSAYASVAEEDQSILRRNVKIHQMDRELYENSKKEWVILRYFDLINKLIITLLCINIFDKICVII